MGADLQREGENRREPGWVPLCKWGPGELLFGAIFRVYVTYLQARGHMDPQNSKIAHIPTNLTFGKYGQRETCLFV